MKLQDRIVSWMFIAIMCAVLCSLLTLMVELPRIRKALDGNQSHIHLHGEAATQWLERSEGEAGS